MPYDQRRAVWVRSLLSATVLAMFLHTGCHRAQEIALPASEAETTAGTEETTGTHGAGLTQPCTTEQTVEQTTLTRALETTSAPVSKSSKRTTTTAQPLNGTRISVPYISQKGILPNGTRRW